MSDEGVCRTAPATPGLSTIQSDQYLIYTEISKRVLKLVFSITLLWVFTQQFYSKTAKQKYGCFQYTLLCTLLNKLLWLIGLTATLVTNHLDQMKKKKPRSCRRLRNLAKFLVAFCLQCYVL